MLDDRSHFDPYFNPADRGRGSMSRLSQSIASLGALNAHRRALTAVRAQTDAPEGNARRVDGARARTHPNRSA
jgi:hypothetical protein